MSDRDATEALQAAGEVPGVPEGVQPVTRFEVIDHREPFGAIGVKTGRVYVANPCAVELSYQDGGRTLKVFVNGQRQSASPGVVPRAVPDVQEINAELLAVLKEVVETLRREAPGTPLNNHRFDGLGIRANNAINRAEAAALIRAVPDPPGPPSSTTKEKNDTRVDRQ